MPETQLISTVQASHTRFVCSYHRSLHLSASYYFSLSFSFCRSLLEPGCLSLFVSLSLSLSRALDLPEFKRGRDEPDGEEEGEDAEGMGAEMGREGGGEDEDENTG